jgi:hypothetical protein
LMGFVGKWRSEAGLITFKAVVTGAKAPVFVL